MAEELGPEVTGIRLGDRVVVHGTAECGGCFYCVRGRTDRCSPVFDRPDGPPQVARLADGRIATAAGNVGGYAAFPQIPLAIQGRTVVSSQNGRVRMHHDIPRQVRTLEDGRLGASLVVSGEYALEEINEALEACRGQRTVTGVIVRGRA